MLGTRRRAAAVCAATVLGVLGAGAWLPAHAVVDPTVTVSPDPATPGTTVTVTMNDYGPCNVEGLGAAASYITLVGSPTGHADVAGIVPGGTSSGTLALPLDLAPATYPVKFSCEVSLGNGVFRTGSVTVVAGAPGSTTVPSSTTAGVTSTTGAPTTTSTTTSTSTSTTSSSTTTSTSTTSTTTSTTTSSTPTSTTVPATTVPATTDPTTEAGSTSTAPATTAPSSAVADASTAATPVAAQPNYAG